MDNKPDDRDIEDDEHKYSQTHNNHYLKYHTQKVPNKSHGENHKSYHHYQLPDENSHMQYSSNIVHIETLYYIFENLHELLKN